MRMPNLGLFKGYPPQGSSKEEADALWEANQRNHPLTRMTEAERVRIASRQQPKNSTPKKPA